MKHNFILTFTAFLMFIVWLALRRVAPVAKWELSSWGKWTEWTFWTLVLIQTGSFIFFAARRSRCSFYIASLSMIITLLVFAILRIGMLHFSIVRSSLLSSFTKLIRVVNSWPMLCGICLTLFCLAWFSRHRPVASISTAALSILTLGLLALRIQFIFSMLY